FMKRPGTIYKAIGGAPAVERIVTGLYDRIGKHPDLIPIFPTDLTETARKQYLFLTQFFAGPRLYSEEFGHPMLKRHHLPYGIKVTIKDTWLDCMEKALIEDENEEPYRVAIVERLTMTAQQMMNTPE